MKELFLNKTLCFINNNYKYSEEEIDYIKYGLEGIYLTFSKLFIVIIINIILNNFIFSLLTLLLFNIIRFFAFGLHANNSKECLFASTVSLCILPYLFNKCSFDTTTTLIIFGIGTVLLFLYAPADTPKRPLKNQKKKMIRKLLSCLVAIIYMSLSLLFINLRNELICALIIELIFILPITYKIMKVPYKNYNYK